MKILAIESSCDETAASVVEDGRKVLSGVIASQVSEHIKFGGVVPEIASRRHAENISAVVNKALSDAELTLDDIDAINLCTGTYRSTSCWCELCKGAFLRQKSAPYSRTSLALTYCSKLHNSPRP